MIFNPTVVFHNSPGVDNYVLTDLCAAVNDRAGRI
jgi:hypothetical protein